MEFSREPGDSWLDMEVDGRRRTALVHVPASHDGRTRLPLVLVFHGGGTNAEVMVEFTGMSELADREGFIAVYPNGSGRQDEALTWNAGNCCGFALRYGVDDVGFVARLLDKLERDLAIDPARVFATGMSNGAMMAYRLANELSERIAAIGPVAGPMGSARVDPSRPVSVIHFHGTRDEFAPYQGGKGLKSLSKATFLSVDQTIDAWVAANRCSPDAELQTLPTPQTPAMPIEQRTYGPGKAGAEVVLYTIANGGHTWPGRTSRYDFLGPTTLDLSASERMWTFFQQHPKT